ncbi:DUF3054 domain-containing protein [Actinomadura rudentiformis]|uniref:DUF3054 domain-containing protein n=1 Tax=Actinomadura rudentiformis TaxID=359158 RepID=A0A6H9YD33_9ACTN|nr:DUF3054 domain-containing protein [Actinomadura rudentiformis]KAB2343392.1 DUF3054 domain-containing protein [Actinomadura rudentiformis]
MVRRVAAGVADVCCVLVFVLIGRASHDEAASLGGFVTTAWPFLVGLAVGWGVTRAWREPFGFLPAAGIWVMTVAVGMVLRAVSGQGTAVAFVVVATVFTGVTLLGWRLATRRLVTS